MNGLDWVLAGTGLFCTLRGTWRGAVSQVFGIAGVLGGFLIAAHFYDPVSSRLAYAFPKLTAVKAVSFVMLFLLTWFCVGIVGYLISSLLRRTGLGFLDRMVGGGVGFGKALALATVIISVLTFFLPPQNRLLHDSLLVPHINVMAREIVRMTPQSVQTLFKEKQKELKRHWLDERGGGIIDKSGST